MVEEIIVYVISRNPITSKIVNLAPLAKTYKMFPFKESLDVIRAEVFLLYF